MKYTSATSLALRASSHMKISLYEIGVLSPYIKVYFYTKISCTERVN